MFRNSTLEELRAYCQMIGIKIHPRHRDEALKALLCKELGLVVDAASPIADVVRTIRPKSDITPPMNLSPEGIWGGKRYRGTVRKPENDTTKSDFGMYVYANGSYGGTKQGYPIKFDAVQVIPAPVYQRSKELETHKHRVQTEEVVLDDVSAFDNVTVFEHRPKFSLDFQVEEGTEHLPGSMQEWYQLRLKDDPKWFEKRDLREMNIICEKLSIDTRELDEKGKKAAQIPLEGLKAAVYTFLYGYPEIDTTEAAA